MQRLSRETSSSPFMVLLAGFQAVLHRYTGAEDIVVGTPIANRTWLQSESLIGSFVNHAGLAHRSAPVTPSFPDLLTRVRRTALDAFAHQDVPFERLVEEMRAPRDLSRSPLFQVMFNVQNAVFSPPELDGLRAEVMQVHRTTAQFDLSLSVDLSLTHRATIEYNTDLFDADRIERLIGHYWKLLGAAVADPGCLVGELALLSPSELAELQSGWAESVVEYDRDGCVDGLFEDQAAGVRL